MRTDCGLGIVNKLCSNCFHFWSSCTNEPAVFLYLTFGKHTQMWRANRKKESKRRRKKHIETFVNSCLFSAFDLYTCKRTTGAHAFKHAPKFEYIEAVKNLIKQLLDQVSFVALAVTLFFKYIYIYIFTWSNYTIQIQIMEKCVIAAVPVLWLNSVEWFALKRPQININLNLSSMVRQ